MHLLQWMVVCSIMRKMVVQMSAGISKRLDTLQVGGMLLVGVGTNIF